MALLARKTCPQAGGEGRADAGRTCCRAEWRRCARHHFTPQSRKPLVGASLISVEAVTPRRPHKCILIGPKDARPRHRNTLTGRMSPLNHGALSPAAELMEMQRDRDLDIISSNKMGQQRRRAADNALEPRSSSPVTVYVDLPRVSHQAFPTIAWDDLEECGGGRRESDSIGSQVNEAQDFGGYALDFMADSPATLESSLSPGELVPFQGCVIPPLTPQRGFSSEDSLPRSCTDAGHSYAQEETLWRDIAQYHAKALGDSTEVNNQLHEILQNKQEEIDSCQERNLHLRQLASRAKNLASVLEKLLTVGEPRPKESVMPCGREASLSPCKRQRLDEGYETESSDSVEDMLRDISTRCNAVLHGAAAATKPRQQSETIRMHGSFSGLQTSISKDSILDRAEPEESASSFRTSIREHSTIRTQVFPNGHAFTSVTRQGGYRFRWVPNDSWSQG
ncbi:multicilin [Brachionichthys hirsutus]|uniref:multicilin n=1 Tax=Brachionichthys hirsutus TaxID=412623 RepID=UPI0036047704